MRLDVVITPKLAGSPGFAPRALRFLSGGRAAPATAAGARPASGSVEERARREQLWNEFQALPPDERIAALRNLSVGSQQEVIDAHWLTTRLNAGIPNGPAAQRKNGRSGSGVRPPLVLWYDSALHGERRYYKGVSRTLQPEFTSEKSNALVLNSLDHAFSVMALCRRAGYSHLTLRRPDDS